MCVYFCLCNSWFWNVILATDYNSENPSNQWWKVELKFKFFMWFYFLVIGGPWIAILIFFNSSLLSRVAEENGDVMVRSDGKISKSQLSSSGMDGNCQDSDGVSPCNSTEGHNLSHGNIPEKVFTLFLCHYKIFLPRMGKTIYLQWIKINDSVLLWPL